MLIAIAIIVALVIWYQYSKKKAQETLRDRAAFDEYVRSKGYTVEQQKELCERFGLNHFDNHTNQSAKQNPLEKDAAIRRWENSLTVVWADSGLDKLSFDYTDSNAKSSPRTIIPDQLFINDDNCFYVGGHCVERNESRVFNVGRMTNLFERDTPTDFYSWCVHRLGVDPEIIIPPDAKTNYQRVIWQGSCPETSFTYRGQGRKRVTVTPSAVLKSSDGFVLVATDAGGNQEQFDVSRIETMLATQGEKKRHFDDWLEQIQKATA
ncbi:WYL domain-containing protein [Salinivibrio kushneri]|uniref:WYL domain-containing protein n=1 Tax=Salinivibrio kushneri TaxID=1908198 RepID=UPI0022B5BDD3|nr:WYL domain-containing protein [Salinivibrio kushneri]WBA11422.1 WYL domain-containing protein [Salinivibrio kushneri]